MSSIPSSTDSSNNNNKRSRADAFVAGEEASATQPSSAKKLMTEAEESSRDDEHPLHHASWWVKVLPLEYIPYSKLDKASCWSPCHHYRPCGEWESLSKDAMLPFLEQLTHSGSIRTFAIFCEGPNVGDKDQLVAYVPEYVLQASSIFMLHAVCVFFCLQCCSLHMANRHV
jgi:hypothetical protein